MKLINCYSFARIKNCPSYACRQGLLLTKRFYLPLLTIIFIINSKCCYTQSDVANSPGNTSPNGLFEKAFDRLGNEYELSDLSIAKQMGGSTTDDVCYAGYFVLHFDEGSLLPGTATQVIDRKNTICQVFSDISEFITSPLEASSNYVHIWIRPIEDYVSSASSSGILGLASSFYIVPSNTSPNFGGIADNAIWQTIHNGIDSYQNVAAPIVSQTSNPGNFFHGVVSFNYQNPSISWNTNLSVAAPNNQYDLYSVVLHEAIHALGFASLINWDGNSKFGTEYQYYSRYDTHLMDNSLSNFLIAATDNSCENGMYNYAFDVDPEITHPGCTLTPTPVNSGSVDNTSCTQAIQYNGSVTVPVYTPSCFEPPSSLSHFEDQCYPEGIPFGNNAYFVMSNANGMGPNYTKRHPTNEERLVLCDLGYDVNASYGPIGSYNFWNQYTGNCNSINIAGVNDGIIGTQYTWNLTLGIPFEITNLTENDYNTNGISCVSLVNGEGFISDVTQTGFTYTANSQGLHLLRYVPMNNEGDIGNITYVYINALGSGCSPDLCNLIPNWNFESTEIECSDQLTNEVNCWATYSSSPELFGRSCGFLGNDIPTSTDLTDVPMDTWNNGADDNNHFVGLFGFYPGNGEDEEAMQTLLSAPLTNGNTYQITFHAMVADGNANPIDAHIAICTSEQPLVAVPSSYDVPNLNQVGDHLIVPGDELWHFMSMTFEYNYSFPANNIIVGYDASMIASTGHRFVFIDDMRLIQVGTDATIDLPDFSCSGNFIIEDLEQYAEPSGGIFTGEGIEEIINGNETTYNFNPAELTAGDYNVTYTVTDNIGCSDLAVDVINVGEKCLGATTITSNTIWSGLTTYYCGDLTVDEGV